MQKRVAAWIFCSFLLVSASLAQGKNASSDVAGTVLDRNNLPVPEAQVRFEGAVNYIARTNSQGMFSLSAIRNGTYTVVVKSRRRFQKFIVKVNDGIDPSVLKVNW